jgi:hypothetical protein
MSIPKAELAWRAKQKKGAIMKPETFKAIERKAAAAGATNPAAVAGHAYWVTAKEKYGKHHSPPINPKFDDYEKY